MWPICASFSFKQKTNSFWRLMRSAYNALILAICDACSLLPSRLRGVMTRRTAIARLVATARRWRVLLASWVLVRMHWGTAVLVVLVVIVVGRAAVWAAGRGAVCRASIAGCIQLALQKNDRHASVDHIPCCPYPPGGPPAGGP